MAGRIRANVSGEKVRVALMQARPRGLTVAELIQVTGLSRSQVAVGIRWIRDYAAAQHLTPLTWRRRDGYRFSDDLADWTCWERTDLRTRLRGFVRAITGTYDPHAARSPDDDWIQTVLPILNGVIAALRMIDMPPPTPRSRTAA